MPNLFLPIDPLIQHTQHHSFHEEQRSMTGYYFSTASINTIFFGHTQDDI